MKKTLLIAAAALAAGVISTQAQPVYSQNIVGYVSKAVPLNWSVQSVPLDASGGNTLTNLIQNNGSFDGAQVFIWSGSSYTTVTLDSSMPTGVGDASDLNPVSSPVINPGTCFFINNGSGNSLTNVFVGNVHIDGNNTSTNLIPASPTLALVAPVIPVGGGITTSLNLTNSNGSLDGQSIYIPNIVGGNFNGYTQVYFDSSLSTGFGDAADLNAVPEPQIPVGSGFFFNNGNATPVVWVQSLGN